MMEYLIISPATCSLGMKKGEGKQDGRCRKESQCEEIVPYLKWGKNGFGS